MTREADAVVVLGCTLDGGGAASPALRRRVRHGIALFEAGAAPLLLLSGGGAGPRSEAAAMREIALAAGVPDAAILTEPASRNTYENAVESAGLLRAHGLRRIVLVSDRYHLPRARLLFRRAGLDVVAADGPPGRGFLRDWPWRLREAAALAYSLVRGWRDRRGR